MPVCLFVCQKVGKYEHIYQKRSNVTFDQEILSEILQEISLRLFHHEGRRYHLRPHGGDWQGASTRGGASLRGNS